MIAKCNNVSRPVNRASPAAKRFYREEMVRRGDATADVAAKRILMVALGVDPNKSIEEVKKETEASIRAKANADAALDRERSLRNPVVEPAAPKIPSTEADPVMDAAVPASTLSNGPVNELAMPAPQTATEATPAHVRDSERRAGQRRGPGFMSKRLGFHPPPGTVDGTKVEVEDGTLKGAPSREMEKRPPDCTKESHSKEDADQEQMHGGESRENIQGPAGRGARTARVPNPRSQRRAPKPRNTPVMVADHTSEILNNEMKPDEKLPQDKQTQDHRLGTNDPERNSGQGELKGEPKKSKRSARARGGKKRSQKSNSSTGEVSVNGQEDRTPQNSDQQKQPLKPDSCDATTHRDTPTEIQSNRQENSREEGAGAAAKPNRGRRGAPSGRPRHGGGSGRKQIPGGNDTPHPRGGDNKPPHSGCGDKPPQSNVHEKPQQGSGGQGPPHEA